MPELFLNFKAQTWFPTWLEMERNIKFGPTESLTTKSCFLIRKKMLRLCK
jgi:hypothetical protein